MVNLFFFILFPSVFIASVIGYVYVDPSISFWLLVSAGLSLLCFVVLLFVSWWRVRQNKNQEKEIKDNQHAKQHDQKTIQTLFRLAEKKLRGKGLLKSGHLYALPWYIMLGESQGGKSKLLHLNGFERLHDSEMVATDADDYLCFWVHDNAVVIEIGPHLFNSSGIVERNLDIFVHCLLKYRPRQGVNGILTLVEITTLANEVEQEISLSRQLQDTILRLEDKLHLTIPVYCIFSKMDEISDLVRFFSSTSPSHERDNPLGITLDCDEHKRFDLQSFDEKSATLLSQFASIQLMHLRNMSDDVAANLLAAPYQFALILQEAKRFLMALGRENRIRNSVWIRGAYFVSVKQQGKEHDLLSQAVANECELKVKKQTEIIEDRQQFFATRLLHQVVLPEQHIVGVNRTAQFRYAIKQASIVLVFSLLLFMIGREAQHNWLREWQWQSNAISALALYETDVLSLDMNYQVGDTISILNEMRTVAEEAKQGAFYQKVSLMENRTFNVIDAMYQTQLQKVLLTKIEELISSELYVYLSLGKPSKVFEILYFYKMLFYPDLLNKEALINYLLDNLQMQGELTQDHVGQLENLLVDLFSHPRYQNDLPMNNELIEVAAAQLEGMSSARLIYDRILNLPENKLEIDFRTQLGDRFSNVFEFSPTFQGYFIPAIFTKQGYSNLDFTPKSDILRIYLHELKDIQGNQNPISISELAVLSKNVLYLYFTDYIHYWNELLGNIQPRHFETVSEFESALSLLQAPTNSPLKDIIDVVVANTTLAVDSQPDTKGVKKVTAGLGLSGVAKKAAKVDKINRAVGGNLLKLQPSFVVNEAFMPLANYINAPENAQNQIAPIQTLLKEFAQLNSYFSRASDSSYPNKLFHDYLMQHARGEQDALVSFQLVSSNTPESIKKWSVALSKNAWSLVVKQGTEHINTEWKERVFDFYRRSIDGRFPFDLKGRGEVRLEDFTDFFKPQGRLDTFVEELCYPFLVSDNGRLKEASIEGLSLPISPSTVKQLERAKKITQLFFGNSGQTLSLTLQMKAQNLSTSTSDFILRSHRRLFSYAHGPRVWRAIQWPLPSTENNLITGFYRNKNLVAEQKYQGNWSLFRFLFAGDESETEKRLVNLLRYSINDEKIEFLYMIENSQYELNKALFNQFILTEKF